MDYDQLTHYRAMLEVIARKLGHTVYDPIDYEPSHTFNDGVIGIDDRQHWLTLRAPMENHINGRLVHGMTIGGMTAKTDEAALQRAESHIKALYIASHFIPVVTVGTDPDQPDPLTWQGVN